MYNIRKESQTILTTKIKKVELSDHPQNRDNVEKCPYNQLSRSQVSEYQVMSVHETIPEK